jgi:hypothetical protein
VTFRVGADRYESAMTFAEYLRSVEKNAELWQGVYRTAMVSAGAVERFSDFAGTWRLLALSEDWCGDAVSTLPLIARLAEQSGVDFRVLSRDANADVMDAHLTAGTRSIPVVMVVDLSYLSRAWWGPRPAPVQRWMRSEGLFIPKEVRGRRKRAWYARDRGRTTIAEVIEMVERTARRL